MRQFARDIISSIGRCRMEKGLAGLRHVQRVHKAYADMYERLGIDLLQDAHATAYLASLAGETLYRAEGEKALREGTLRALFAQEIALLRLLRARSLLDPEMISQRAEEPVGSGAATLH